MNLVTADTLNSMGPERRDLWLGIHLPIFAPLHYLLYPQYETVIREILPEQWVWLQQQAFDRYYNREAAPEVKAHWLSIARATPPFGMIVRRG